MEHIKPIWQRSPLTITKRLEEQGNNHPVAWLRNMAQQLGTYLNRQAGTIEEYQGFLWFFGLCYAMDGSYKG
ncbi:hypothetical protein [Microcystis viridis]|uniref:hypothetical protein n=1 Tax=Microcystis viridis TaxID=44822 RepID=UPI001E5171CD|nr:hypothetical protein [Microcystis viridis]